MPLVLWRHRDMQRHGTCELRACALHHIKARAGGNSSGSVWFQLTCRARFVLAFFLKKKKQNTPGASPRSNYTHLGSFVKLRLWIRQRWTNAVNLPGKNTSNRILSRRSKLSRPKWMHKNKNSIRHRHFKRHSKESIDPPLVWLELSFASRREDASVSRSILGTDF